MGIMGVVATVITTGVNPTLNNMCWVVGRVFSESERQRRAPVHYVCKAVAWAVANKGAKVVNLSLSVDTRADQRVMEVKANLVVPCGRVCGW
jgi:uncharacterized protein YqgV (UPF0045/DUF77 family)